jgi:hypothetical protein
MTSDAEKGGRGRSASAGSLSVSGGVPLAAASAGTAINGSGRDADHDDDDDDGDEFNDVDEGRHDDVDMLTLADLKREEDLVRDEEEAAVQRKRTAAAQLALKRGLSVDDSSSNVRVFSRSCASPSAYIYIYYFLSFFCVESFFSDFCSPPLQFSAPTVSSPPPPRPPSSAADNADAESLSSLAPERRQRSQSSPDAPAAAGTTTTITATATASSHAHPASRNLSPPLSSPPLRDSSSVRRSSDYANDERT